MKYNPGWSSRIRILEPDPVFYTSRIQGSKRHRLSDPDPQHCYKETLSTLSLKKLKYSRIFLDLYAAAPSRLPNSSRNRLLPFRQPKQLDQSRPRLFRHQHIVQLLQHVGSKLTDLLLCTVLIDSFRLEEMAVVNGSGVGIFRTFAPAPTPFIAIAEAEVFLALFEPACLD